MNEQIGSLCVRRDDGNQHWLVSICQGGGKKLVIRRFEAQEKATEFALEERARRQRDGIVSLTIHFADDCPCGGGGSTW